MLVSWDQWEWDGRGASDMERVRMLEEPSPSPARNIHNVLLNNPFGKKTAQKTQRKGPVIYLALPQKVLAIPRSCAKEFGINPVAKGWWQVGCEEARDHGQVSHDAAGVSGLFLFAPPYP